MHSLGTVVARFSESLGTVLAQFRHILCTTFSNKEPATGAFNLPLIFFCHREKGRKIWKEEKQTIGFFFGVCRIELESLIFNTM